MISLPDAVDEHDSESAALMTVERGLKVLRAFRSDRTPLSNAELVRRTGLPKATVSRLTSTLLQVGFLRQVPGRREFELAAGSLGIGHAYLDTNEMLQAAQPLLQNLADQLDVSVALGIQDGLDLLYIGYRVSRKVATLRLGVGSVLPMSTTSIGRAYLWALPCDQQRQLIAEYKRHAGDEGDALERSIHASFDELASTGTCAVMGGYQRSTFGVAMPIWAGRQRIPISMSCGKADVELDLQAERERIAPALKQTAAALQELLADFDGQL
ncbi:IclR family transcriptional regulator [Bordetella bronchiseptica]|uniref:IclR family transcriptional regulator n=1 Tax=Bordetella bronchiseptica TaxID=518 RepID=UPI00081D30ED|nr:IclR family transcriptional regulator [Bordetella bronchiseptica]AOB25266.1 IclR family transcriptional regulator [Bordetella bronchiseptica]AZW42512.1 IclR family transcriptional regulator [Bordetella bronchiseptica]MBN3267938.1 IclR family transcriptional regulator [Bordetella bronchiseptica]